MDQHVTNQSYSLTKSQKRVWFNSKVLDKPLPNIVMVFELIGNLDIWALRKAIENLVDENSVLKSTIYSSTEALERIINPAVRGNLEIVDLSEATKKPDIFWLLQNIAGISFNLGTGPLFNFHLIVDSPEHYYFTILIHPIIVDRYSLKYLVEEISRHYNLMLDLNEASSREELFDFNNIVELEKKFYASDKCRQGLTHWTNTLKSNQFFLDLPKKGYFANQEYVDSPFFEITLNETVTKNVKKFAVLHQVDVSTVLMSAYQVLLQRYTGNNNIVINYSCPVSYTDKKVFGCLENRLPLRVMLQDNMTFNEVLKLTKTQLAYDSYYKDIQITDIVKSIRDKYDSRFSGVFTNTSFDVNYLPYDELKLDHITVNLIPKYMKKFVTECLAFYYRDAGDSISIIADFDDHLDSTAVKNLMLHYEVLLAHCVLDPHKPISRQPLLTPDEYQQMVMEWNDTDTSYPHELVHRLFEKQVLKTPDKAALFFKDKQLTYNELNKIANQYAHYLARLLEPHRAIERELYVGICLDRSIEMIISKIAILKAGAAYVPLDPQFPKERLSYILDDSHCKVVMTTQALRNNLDFLTDQNRQIICVDSQIDEISAECENNLLIEVSLTDVAYVIYTSGSTGLPKGVMIEHKAIPNLLTAWRDYFHITSESRVLQFVSMNFDVAVPDVFCTLMHGACLFILSDDLKQSPEKLYRFLDFHAITAAFITPAFLRLLPRLPLPALQVLSFGGDVCDLETADFWMKGRVFLNGYGPTETTVAATYSRPLKPGDPISCIGKPLPNMKAYILDENLNPIPMGMIGELYIGGVGVGRGYMNRPDLTAERFIPDLFTASQGRMYKTGDLVRWLPGGHIEYIGRADFEVKIRGFRIQLGDIEYVLQSFPGVTQVTTKIWEKPGMEKMIAAYYILKKGKTVNTRELRDHIQKYLPEYMVPSYLIELDKMPIAVSGKLNKALLPDPLPKVALGAVDSPEEQILKEIWIELFKLSSESVTGYSDFFDLGGHSLLATQLVSRVKSRLSIEITVKDIFQNSQLKQLAKLIKESQPTQTIRFLLSKAPEQERHTLSYSQMRLWYFFKAVPLDQTYNLLSTITFSNNVDIITLRKALVKLFSLHEVFRTTFIEYQGEAYSKVHDGNLCEIPLVDCQSEESIEVEIAKERAHIFDLGQLPLFRCKLLLSESQGMTVLFNIHHILFDGWSLNIFLRELGDIYTKLVRQELFVAPPRSFEFKDYAFSQKNWNQQGLFDQQLTYWQRKLFKPMPVLELPLDFNRPKVAQFKGDYTRFQLPSSLVVAAKKLAAANKTSLFSLFLSVYYVFLHRITHQKDLIVASPIANRTQQELEQLVGYCANVVAYRAQFHEKMQFDDLLKLVHEDVISTQENQDLPFDIIVNQVQTDRDTSRNPIFQTMFVLQSGFKLSNHWSTCDVSYQLTEQHTKTSKFDLTLILYDNSIEDAISGYFEFNTALFRKETISRFIQYFTNILRSVSDNAQRAIENIPLLSSDEHKLIVNDWNMTSKSYGHVAIHRAFERQVDQSPAHTAVVFENERMTYAQLNEKSNQLAYYIRKQYQFLTGTDLLQDTFIGLCVDRSVDMVVSILAILKAGAAYLPLDPAYPRDRLAYMLNDAKAKIILTKQSVLNRMDFFNDEDYHMICVDSCNEIIAAESLLNLVIDVKPADLAYIIYTSGSTGLPKGVLIEHKGVPNLAYACRDIFGLTSESKVLHFSSINFDSAVYELFNTLLNGATLYIVSEQLRVDPEKLMDYLYQQQITFATLPPALLRVLPHRELPALNTLAFAGDICDQETMRYWAQNRKFYNAYGPTEITVCATVACLQAEDSVNCIGKPLANYKIYVLDEYLSPVPIGVLGELYVGGVGLARGYLNRPDLTVERFIVNPFSDDPSDRLYKTGDVVRWCEEGNLEYIGRSDFQVQIRGFRVELGEIDEILHQYSAIKQVAVAAVGDDINKKLVAYFTLQHVGEELVIDELKKYLHTKLPDYMIPSAFIKIDKMPLSLSGKVDKKALPKLDEALLVAHNTYIAPRNERENQLVEIWRSLFNHQKIGVNDNFFNLGGNSLLSIRMLAQVKEVCGHEISLAKFFQYPTIEGLYDLMAGQYQILDVNAAVMADAAQQVVYHPVVYDDKCEVRHILLTGANGFLGVYLLNSLLKNTIAQIYCLVRGKDLKDAQDKLDQSLQKFLLSDGTSNPRITVVVGDLSQKRLGMTNDQWEFMADHIDAIYHNGALVNHIYDYQMLKSTNVGSTIELLKLCTVKKAKLFHYISTSSAASQFNDAGIAIEEGPGHQPPAGPGYILSKWVSEKIIYQAAEQGLRISIYRPGNITGHSKTGKVNYENNHALLLLKSCIQLGVAPEWDDVIEMTPVDVLSEAIVRLSLTSGINNKNVYHLNNPHHISWKEYFYAVNQHGFKLKLIPADDWIQHHIKDIGEENALYPLKEIYLESSGEQSQIYFETKATQQCLQQLGIYYPNSYAGQIRIYLSYLQEREFIAEIL
jgi:amino acid adenylation domain-containing protein/thioester reductase-like protein